MHENELTRETNTGQWLLRSLPSSSQHIWQRKSPCPELIALLQDDHYLPVLLFPSDESISVNEVKQRSAQQGKTPLFIILDGTWQEAKKMLRKSPWLSGIPLAHITPSQASVYQLRRNQSEGHLCTLEVASEVVRELGEDAQANSLTHFLTHFMEIFQADKSGHPYQRS
tara:strand:- start:5752 stop:6258 length:507 start_codon:yes stop_codon:yes gene_type:complete